MARLIALTLALLLGAALAWSQARLPSPAPADAPAPQFSAGRAMAVVREIAQAPHPVGSPENRRVRDRLLSRMAALGLTPQVRRGDAVEPAGVGLQGATTESLVGVLPGRDRAQPPVLLMAHYDSRPGAPGAADDGAGVAAALETIRAIRARGTPARDVALVLTDGEEACLCGARHVFATDPLARRAGLVLNLEARGSGGRALMFQTGRDDAGAVRLFRDTAVRPMAGALFGEVYARLPNDTDFSIARAAGAAGLNYAFTGDAFDYHAPTDRPDRLAPGSLQDLGDQVLAAADGAAFGPALPARRPDLVYGVIFGNGMLVYPPAWGWLPLGLSAALAGLGLLRAQRREPFPASDLARGAAAALYALLLAAALLHLAGLAAVTGEPAASGARRLLALSGRWEAALLLAAVGALLFAAAEAARGRRGPAALLPLAAAGAACLLARGLDPVAIGAGGGAAILALVAGGRRLSRPGGWGGVLILGGFAVLGLQLVLPLAAYVLAWPLALGALAAAASSLGADRRPAALAALGLLAALGVGWAGVHAHLIVEVVGLPELLCLSLLQAAFVLWPLAQPEAGAPPARLPGRALLALGAALVVAVRLSNPWSPDYPQSGFIAYQLDQDAGRAWRVARRELPAPWSDAALRAEGAPSRRALWPWPEEILAAPAGAVPLPPPDVALQRVAADQVRLTVRPPAGVRTLTLELAPDTAARLVQVGGAVTDLVLPAGRWTRLTWAGLPPDGLALRLRVSGPGRLRLKYALGLDGWPAGSPPRPAPPPAVMPVEGSPRTLAVGVRTLGW